MREYEPQVNRPQPRLSFRGVTEGSQPWASHVGWAWTCINLCRVVCTAVRGTGVPPVPGVFTFRPNRRGSQCRSGFQPDWSVWKPDLRNRQPLVGGDRGGALCAGVSCRIESRLLLRRSPFGNRTYAIGSPSSGEIEVVAFAPESHAESKVVCCCEEVRLETGPTPLAPFVSCRTVKSSRHERPARAHGRDGRATTSATIDKLRRSSRRVVCGAASLFAGLDSLPELRVSIRAMRRMALLERCRS
jgi:hypothetical protein